MTDTARLRLLNGKPVANGDYVLYWMQQSQRAEENHALEHAIARGNALGLPVLVGFGLTPDYPDANLRHYAFMLEGLREVRRALDQRGIRFVLRHGRPPEVALRLGRRAACIVCDRGYLRHQKSWREELAREARCPVEQLECDATVPVETASVRQEFSARNFRPKVMRLYRMYLDEPIRARPQFDSRPLDVESLDIDDEDAVWGPLSVDTSVKPVPGLTGGTSVAKRRLGVFIRAGLGGYAGHRGRPASDFVSRMSPYLHFGQISPAYVARRIHAARAAEDCKASYLDELIVRRELCVNYVHYCRDYDRPAGLPRWARDTLKKHQSDRRPHRYTLRELEGAATHDPYWNAAMNEMKHTGHMHNHMRMYWGKQILAWTERPETAYRITLGLNHKYFLDGRDPSSYANVGWIFGLHDRPWPEREIFGTVRSMTMAGLEQKADPGAYVEKVRRLCGL